MSLDRELEEQLERAKAKWDSLTPAQQAKYLRRKISELGRRVDDLDTESKKPKQ